MARRKSIPSIDSVKKRFDAAWAARCKEYVDAIVDALDAATEFPVEVELGADFADRARLFEMLKEKGFAARMSELGVLELSDPGEDDADEEDGFEWDSQDEETADEEDGTF